MLRRPESITGSETSSRRTSCSRTNHACTLSKTDGRTAISKEHMAVGPKNTSTEMSCRFGDGRQFYCLQLTSQCIQDVFYLN